MSGAAEQTDDPMIVRAMDQGRFVRVNDAFKARTGYDAAELAGKPFLDWIVPGDRAGVQAALDQGDKSFVARHVAQDGHPLPLRIQVEKHGEDFFVLGRCATAPAQPEPDQSKPAEATMSGTLDAIARIIEEQNPGFKCSILLVEQGRFVFGAGPSLPDDYNAAVNGYAVGPAVGSCGTAIFWNTPVIVEDIQADPLWAALAALAKQAGVAACWSHPFVGSSGQVLGALAFYAPAPCAPTAEQLSRLKAAARITGLAVERGRAEEALKRAEAATQAARNRLQATLNALPDLLFEVDAEGRLFGYHSHRDELLAVPPEVLLGKRFADVLPPDAAEACQRAIDGAVQHGFSYGETYRLALPQGEHWFELSAAPLQTGDESGPHFVMISRDITQRHADALALEETKNALASSRDLLQQVIDTVPLRIFWKDREGRYLGCNPAFAHDAGKVSPAELLGRDDFGMGWAEQTELYRADDQRVMESGQPRLNFEEPRTTPDGKTLWLRTSKVPLYDPMGEIMGVLGVYDDITEYKRQERRAALAMDAAKILVWEIDFASGKLDYEGSALANLGLDASEAPDTLESWLARVHPDDRPRFMAQVEQALLPGTERGLDCEYRFQRPHDGYVWLHNVGRVTHRDAADRPLLGAGYSVNIDARKRAEAELHHSNSLLVAALESTADGILVVEAHGKVISFNHRFLELWRIPRLLAESADDAKLLGFVQKQLVNPAEFLAKVEALYRSPEESSWDELHFLDGRVFERYSIPQRLRDGRIVGRVWSFRDVTARKLAERELEAERTHLRTLVNTIPDLIWLKDTEGAYLACNPEFERFFGASERDILGKTDYDFVPRELADSFHRNDLKVMADDKPSRNEEWITYAGDGRRVLLETTKTPMRMADGRLIGVLGIAHDITEIRQAEQALKAREQYQRALLDNFPFMVWLKDKDSNYLAVNQVFAKACGCASPDDLLGKSDLDVWPRELAEGYRADDRAVLDSGKPKTLEEPIVTDGGSTWIETYKSPVMLDGKIIGTVGFARDISERRNYQQQLERIAHYDSLTGLPNRVLLADRLQQAMLQVQRHNRIIAVGYIDLDGFKAINDQYGHDTGDQLLISLAGHMRHALRESDTLARLGGDEFVAIFRDLTDVESTAPMLTRLLAAASEMFHKDGHALRVSASLGVTYYPQAEGVGADQLLRQADQAMYQAKLAGKNRYHIFDIEQDRSVRGHHESLERINRR